MLDNQDYPRDQVCPAHQDNQQHRLDHLALLIQADHQENQVSLELLILAALLDAPGLLDHQGNPVLPVHSIPRVYLANPFSTSQLNH